MLHLKLLHAAIMADDYKVRKTKKKGFWRKIFFWRNRIAGVRHVVK